MQHPSTLASASKTFSLHSNRSQIDFQISYETADVRSDDLRFDQMLASTYRAPNVASDIPTDDDVVVSIPFYISRLPSRPHGAFKYPSCIVGLFGSFMPAATNQQSDGTPNTGQASASRAGASPWAPAPGSPPKSQRLQGNISAVANIFVGTMHR